MLLLTTDVLLVKYAESKMPDANPMLLLTTGVLLVENAESQNAVPVLWYLVSSLVDAARLCSSSICGDHS